MSGSVQLRSCAREFNDCARSIRRSWPDDYQRGITIPGAPAIGFHAVAERRLSGGSLGRSIYSRWKNEDRSEEVGRVEGGDIAARRFLSGGRAITRQDIPAGPVPEGRKDYLETRKRSPPYLRPSWRNERGHRSPAILHGRRDIETIHLRSPLATYDRLPSTR